MVCPIRKLAGWLAMCVRTRDLMDPCTKSSLGGAACFSELTQTRHTQTNGAHEASDVATMQGSSVLLSRSSFIVFMISTPAAEHQSGSIKIRRRAHSSSRPQPLWGIYIDGAPVSGSVAVSLGVTSLISRVPVFGPFPILSLRRVLLDMEGKKEGREEENKTRASS